MGLPNIFNVGRSGMQAAKTAIATTGHNITNANTEGYSRQRVETTPSTPNRARGTHDVIGTGVDVKRVSRINDEYVEKQLRNGSRDLAHFEEKEMALKQTEDIFNELNGEGLNCLMTRFFNEFRKLANEPDNQAVRESVREASQALTNDFKRLRHEVLEVQEHIDARLQGHTQEINSLGKQLAELNQRIREIEITGAPANDLEDQRDTVLKKLASYMDLSMHKDNFGNYVVDVKGVGPLVAGDQAERFSVFRTGADEEGKPEGGVDISSSGTALGKVTHSIKGGRIGALVETRDQTLSTILSRLDDLAYAITESVNAVHQQGFTRGGFQGVSFFKPLATRERAAEFMDLSDAVRSDTNNIAAAAQPQAPGDNRIALAISGIQNMRMLNDGAATMDDFYNSIISDVGTITAKNRGAISQQREIMTQLNKTREQISGVSIDEETANLMQFQHSFDASAKVIQVADELLKTVLDLKR